MLAAVSSDTLAAGPPPCVCVVFIEGCKKFTYGTIRKGVRQIRLPLLSGASGQPHVKEPAWSEMMNMLSVVYSG